MIKIAIDGPGGAGKSSAAKLVAKRLGIIYVDTGALYRAIGLYMKESGISIDDPDAVAAALPGVDLKLRFTDRQILLLGGKDVGESIRTPEISMAASKVSAIPAVRTFLLETQKSIASRNSVIMDGRDIGTVILPDADLKIFLSASAEARAKRRFSELQARGVDTTLEQVLADMEKRDRDDSTRDIAPCVPAQDAVLLDNSALTLEETADAIEAALKKKLENKKIHASYRRWHFLLAKMVRFFNRVHVSGLENLPTSGGFLLCANHIAIRDVFLIAASLPPDRLPRFIAKKELFSVPILKHIIRALGAVPIDRGNNDVGALRTSVELLKSGECVTIFPQGHRHPGVNPATTEPRNGAALIAYRADRPVIPICIKTKKFKYAPFRRVDLIIGKPIDPIALGFSEGGSQEYEAATRRIFAEIVKLGGYDALPSGENK